MISNHVAKAVQKIFELDPSLSREYSEQVRKIVEGAVLASVQEAVQRCRDAATTCCAKDSAMTKHIREEIRQAETALIANLSGMR